MGVPRTINRPTSLFSSIKRDAVDLNKKYKMGYDKFFTETTSKENLKFMHVLHHSDI
jgi:hypothetical protein